MKGILSGGAVALLIPALAVVAIAASGTLLDTVGLPGNVISVAGTFDGTYYMTVPYLGIDQIDIYLPPAPDAVPGPPADPATVIASKNIVDAADGVTPVQVSALAWDPLREELWGAYQDKVWLIDLGDPTVSDTVEATFQFSPSVQAPGEVGPGLFSDLPGVPMVDGLAYDVSDDSIWYSPDIHDNVYHFASDGTYLGKVTPKNAAGVADGDVSGVTIGSNNTLYIGRDGNSEIRRIDKTTGAFISTFATTSDRVEDLTCDPVTYAPKEAILAKDAYYQLYEAFEVEPGTCPLPEKPKTESELIAGQHIVVGVVTVTSDLDNVYVTYTTTGHWVMDEVHLQLGDELEDIPQTKKGNPKVGHFEFNVEFNTPVTTYSVTKPISELNLDDNDVVVAAHAVVTDTVTGQTETAWGDTQGLQFPGKNWAMYFVHEL
ncbi:MAG: hypothetical protein KKA90_02320 [Nanoarchaeota archaeon]|nr:hypothetical protein [Nanoarchaeota archaeon]